MCDIWLNLDVCIYEYINGPKIHVCVDREDRKGAWLTQELRFITMFDRNVLLIFGGVILFQEIDHSSISL